MRAEPAAGRWMRRQTTAMRAVDRVLFSSSWGFQTSSAAGGNKSLCESRAALRAAGENCSAYCRDDFTCHLSQKSGRTQEFVNGGHELGQFRRVSAFAVRRVSESVPCFASVALRRLMLQLAVHGVRAPGIQPCSRRVRSWRCSTSAWRSRRSIWRSPGWSIGGVAGGPPHRSAAAIE